MGLFGRKRKVGDAGIAGTARVVDVDTADFWRTTPNNDHFHLAEIGLGHVVNELTLEITLDDGRDAYQVTDEFKVPTKFDSHVVLDTQLPVLADPDDDGGADGRHVERAVRRRDRRRPEGWTARCRRSRRGSSTRQPSMRRVTHRGRGTRRPVLRANARHMRDSRACRKDACSIATTDHRLRP